ncbi:uncharacterized protein HMPREF1541_08172 [Cyphellophora europaea CBS 101466]|uniref:GH16 domain-containing protein n=1 Tax=Cyphellophora europaea (strain CBS 101466) TaxID=1220924 RepID=W2RL09_CYPE1|nr:uncharacterized protein HMPREF1541_08172 [Cyphellophora europaea CBS 101466]ETN37182.1 hypothetical protein HMPREF1541_08172 [Cyphellophora europaea CBS 101466]
MHHGGLLPRELLLLALSFTLIAPATVAAQQQSSPQCDCFLTSDPTGNKPTFFTHHYFIDFRNASGPFPAPPNITAADTSGTEALTSSYFTTPTWSSFWSINNATGLYNFSSSSHTPQVASAGNVFIASGDGDNDGDDDSSSRNNGTFLALRTSRNRAFQSVAELTSRETDMQHLSVRARLRVLASNDSAGQQSVVETGAVFGLFTYQSDTQESDLEILTDDDSSTVHCSNQPDYDAKKDRPVEGASSEVAMPDGVKWTAWNTQRLDWLDGVSRWWVEGVNVLNKTVNVPKKPSAVVLNLWSDGGDWSGNMTVGRQARVGIEWIEVAYNVSRDSGRGSCKVGCWIDGDQVKDVGAPVLAFNSTMEGAAASRRVVASDLLAGLVGVVLLFSLL